MVRGKVGRLWVWQERRQLARVSADDVRCRKREPVSIVPFMLRPVSHVPMLPD